MESEIGFEGWPEFWEGEWDDVEVEEMGKRVKVYPGIKEYEHRHEAEKDGAPGGQWVV